MKTVNMKLKRYYPHLSENISLEVSEKIAATLSMGGRLCDSYKRRKREHDECSLRKGPGRLDRVVQSRYNKARGRSTGFGPVGGQSPTSL